MTLATVRTWFGGCFAVVALLVVARWIIHKIVRVALWVNPNQDRPLELPDRLLLRYQGQELFVLLFAWFKFRMDPMFRELPVFLNEMPGLRTVLDLGCGYGVAGSSLLESCAGVKLFAIDPNPKRVRAAACAFGQRGEVFLGSAPDFEVPGLPSRFDAVFVLDVIHYLSDSALELTLARIRARLDAGGFLVIRVPMPPPGAGSILWNLNKVRRNITGRYECYRSVEQIGVAIERAGFAVHRRQVSGTANHELFWFVSTALATSDHRENL